MPKKQSSAKKESAKDEKLEAYFNNYAQQLFIEQQTKTIPPKCFRIEYTGGGHFTTVDYDAELNYKYIDHGASWFRDYSQFHKELNPVTLEVADKQISSVNVSNDVSPCGTVGISGRLKECFTTDGLYQCAGAAFIDKKHNLQTLVHVCPTIPNQANEKLLNYILSFSKPEDLEIYIAPGEMEDTDKTIEFIVNTIKCNNKNYDIKFANFPDSENTTLVLKDGKLMCTKKENNHITATNPKNKIIYA